MKSHAFFIYGISDEEDLSPSIIKQLTKDKTPPSTNAVTQTADLIVETIDTIPTAASESSNVTDKPVVNTALQ